jgi:hypothetical protein
MLEQKHFGKIAAISAAIWRDLSKTFMPKRMPQIGRFNFGFRGKTIILLLVTLENKFPQILPLGVTPSVCPHPPERTQLQYGAQPPFAVKMPDT